MATVADLTPGDLVTNPSPDGPAHAVFVARIPHPEYPGLMLVAWRLDDGTWSFDALHPHQEVGQLTPQTTRGRADRLCAALEGAQHP